ncbi:MAG: ParA family protein [Nocardioidaceae bacterium]
MTDPLKSDPRLSRVIAIANGKGGCGKTAVTANVAGSLAAAGNRVLTIDLDPQGDLGNDLGIVDTDIDDEGRALLDALQYGGPLPSPIKDVRANLDCYIGGQWLDNLTPLDLAGRIDGGLPAAFTERLAAVADDYDLVFIDCPPRTPSLVAMAFAAARYILIPIKHDKGSRRGLRGVGPIKVRAQQTNPDLTWLGAILFDHNPNATQMRAKTYARLDDIQDRVPIFDAFVRHSPKAAQDAGIAGQLIYEMAADLSAQKAATLQQLKLPAGKRALPTTRYTPTTEPLADDYRALALELLHRILEHEEAPLQVTGS